MKGKRYPMEAKIRILRAVDSGQAILDVCREQNLSEVSFHRWKRQFGQMEINEARRLKELERENRELKKMLACGAAAAVKCAHGKTRPVTRDLGSTHKPARRGGGGRRKSRY